MIRCLVILLLAYSSHCVLAQTSHIANTTFQSQHIETQSITPESYTDDQMLAMGLTAADIADYHAQRATIKGQWWGHMNPVEFLMYASENENERARYAKLYLSSNLPKAIAERDAMVTMYTAAREIYAEQYGLVQSTQEKRPALFVNIGCKHCSEDVLEIINVSQAKVDVYLTGLDAFEDSSQKQQAMVDWARALQIHPQSVTLNDDNGIYEQLNHQPLVTYHLMNP